jgi:hypothetical protein
LKSQTDEEGELRKEVALLNDQMAKMQKEISKIQVFEKSLAYHELVLAKKAKDLNEIDERLEKKVSKENIEEMKKELKKIVKHDELIFENSRYIHEIVNEIDKLRRLHDGSKAEHTDTIQSHKKESDEKMAALKKAFDGLEALRTNRKKEIMDRISAVEYSLNERMNQIDYQNRLIMKYLKRIDEKFFLDINSK